MQISFALLSFAAVAFAAPQGVTENITPSSPAPEGCSPDFSGTFEIQAINNTFTKRSFEKRAECGGEGTLVLTLAGGRLTDAQSRTGYIASNYQFQFDAPPQTPSIYTGGFSACSNSSLALGGSAVFYQCLSGGFYNLYDRHWAEQCEPILLQILPCGSTSASAPVSQVTDGQPQASSAVSAPVSQIGDGQPQATSALPISELTDGQPQVPTGAPAPISQISDGQIQATSAAAPISQISDGQIQATSAAAPISQISDGQIQATSAAAPISQISDGQIQATSAAAPISQISDGQIQATSAVAPISQISDGQIQATSAVAPISQISDGQIQATPAAPAPSASGPVISQIGDGQIQNPANATSTPVAFTGAGSSIKVFGTQVVAVALGVVAVAFL